MSEHEKKRQSMYDLLNTDAKPKIASLKTATEKEWNKMPE